MILSVGVHDAEEDTRVLDDCCADEIWDEQVKKKEANIDASPNNEPFHIDVRQPLEIAKPSL